MITLDQYLGKFAAWPDVTPERKTNAYKLLNACAQLRELAATDGVSFPINPNTKSGVSGSLYGGFRPQACPIGASKSSHKEGLAVDLYDPKGAIDDWCMAHLPQLEQCGIYLEHPSATNGWSHWSIKAPKSGNRVFYP